MAPSILQNIITQIKIDENKLINSFVKDKFILLERNPPIDILDLFKSTILFTICECKKGSPSKGVIRENYMPVDIATAYIKAGASAISVITEKNYFFGEKIHLKEIRKLNDSIPLLRKDFIFDVSQVYESFNLGADMVLLIVAALSPKRLKYLHEQIINLNMTPLVEIHNEEELKIALNLELKVLGINNRNLNTFEVNLQTGFDLLKLVPSNIPVICESGISTPDDITKIKTAGFKGILVGESLLRNPNIEKGLKDLINV